MVDCVKSTSAHPMLGSVLEEYPYVNVAELTFPDGSNTWDIDSLKLFIGSAGFIIPKTTGTPPKTPPKSPPLASAYPPAEPVATPAPMAAASSAPTAPKPAASPAKAEEK